MLLMDERNVVFITIYARRLLQWPFLIIYNCFAERFIQITAATFNNSAVLIHFAASSTANKLNVYKLITIIIWICLNDAKF